MSKEKPVSSSAAPGAPGGKPSPAAGGAPQGSKAASGSAPRKSGGGGGTALAGVALIAALGAGGGAGYLWYEQQQMTQKQQSLESEQLLLAERQSALSVPADAGVDAEIEGRLAQLAEMVEANREAEGAQQAALQAMRLEVGGDVQRLAAENADLMQRLAEIGRTDRDDWRLAEVEYLLRLAHQRVVMGGELDSAAALLATADKILYDLNMAGLLHVRKQVARDLAAVQAAAKLDVAGIYLRLDALQDQLGKLQFYGMPERAAQESTASPDTASEGYGDWRDELLAFSKQLIVVRKGEGEMEAELTGVGQNLMRIQLALKLEQAKNALLLHQDPIYHAALDDARQLITTHFVPESSVTVAFLEALDELNREAVAPELPDISASQEVVRAYIDNRYKTQGQAPAVDESASQAPAASTGQVSDAGDTTEQEGAR